NEFYLLNLYILIKSLEFLKIYMKLFFKNSFYNQIMEDEEEFKLEASTIININSSCSIEVKLY
ncbi:hypothetical protein, partial [Clostridium sp. UBA1056]|uniref:hypothetical protein n=1 Tax=Clostridium sp. UBA1056 TaxID=1946346 RepID=UPI003217FBF4